MWLMTKLGFFSVVCARPGYGAASDAGIDPDRVMIRARMRGHLLALRERFAPELEKYSIQETPRADYRWRLICPKSVWAARLRELALYTGYDNFKDACGATHGEDSPYVHALHTTWSTMLRLQADNE